MIAIIDYGMGNLRSVQKALEAAGGVTRITCDPRVIAGADKIVLPGVGAVRPAMERLEELGLIKVLRSVTVQGKPFLGICLGFQLLFDFSAEGGKVAGLGILPGVVERFPATVKVPHMGWNSIKVVQAGSPMLKGINDGDFFYFCHSYFVCPAKETAIAATTDYGLCYSSAVCHENIWGVQFHPEKSQASGFGLLRNFVLW